MALVRSIGMDQTVIERTAWVYIMTNRPRGVLYVGSTTQLEQRIWEHKLGLGSKFTARHGLRLVVHVEEYDDTLLAQAREQSLKRWRRRWKFDLIERLNPLWEDLYETLQL